MLEKVDYGGKGMIIGIIGCILMGIIHGLIISRWMR